MRGPYAGAINEAQQLAAYNSGQRDAAISLAKEKAAAPYAKTAGTEAGLVYDEYVAEAVESEGGNPPGQTAVMDMESPSHGEAVTAPFNKGARGRQSRPYLTVQTAERINTVAKALGVRVRLVDHIDAGTMGANGDIRGSDILIAWDAADPVAQVFGHEITHRMQELAPEQFRVFRAAAMDHMADSAARAKIDDYRAQGMTIQYEAAMDDVAADYAGQLMEDGRVLDEFIERHRTDKGLLQKLRDAFRHLVAKLTGADKRKAQTAEGKLSAALDAAAEQADSLTETGQSAEGEVKYSIKYDRDNTPYVIVETDILKDVPQSEWARTVKDNLRKKFPNGITVGNNVVKITRKSWGELTHSKYTMQLSRENPQVHSDKLRATDSADEIIQTAQSWVNEAPLHPRNDDIIDFARGTVQIRIGGNDYTADVVVGNRGKDGLLLYDIIDLLPTQIQERTEKTGAADTAAPSALEGQHDRQTAPIADTIPQSGEESNPQYSLKGATITRSYNQLLRENDALRERLDYWRGQTRRTKEVTVDKKSVTAAAKDLVEKYGAQLDKGELSGRLQALYDHMAKTWYDKGETEGSDVWKGAEEIARDIAESAVAEWSLSDEFPGLKETLRDTPITLGREYDGDIRNETFRRDYRGRLKLSAQGPTNVDAVYAELAESYPGLFPEDITHPADQLEQIMSVTDSLYTVEEQSRFSGQMEEAVTGITNEIVEQFLDLPLTKGTFADWQAAKLDKLRAENKQAVRDAIARERETRQRQLQALKNRYAQSRENAAGRRADSKARDRLLHIAKRLQNRKLPEVNRTLLNEYIGDLDTVSKSMTGLTLAKLTSLRDWYSEQKSNNPDFIADPKIERDLQRLSKRQIADLSAQEVADLTQVLLNIENEIRTQRRLIDSQERRDVYAAGEAAIRDIEASAGSKPTGLWSLIDKGIVTETLSPLRQVRRMTGYAKDSPLTKVTQELADGQRAMYDYQMKAEAQFAKYTGDKGFTKSFAGPKAKGIQIQGMGKDGPATVTITPAMRASLYLHSLNDQNLKHIRDGGITVPDWTLYRKGQIAEAYARGTTIRLTPSQVRSITANMTQKERAFALAAHRYFNVTSKEAVNSVSEKLKGYSIAQVEHYFPIRTDSSFTRADFEAVKFDGTIEGMGFLKERIDAGNPILLRDMNVELEQSYKMHSKYAGLAIPVRNFYKLWNVTTGQWVDTGGGTGYTGAEGGDSYGDQYRETAGDHRRSEDPGADAGGTGGAAGADREGPGRIAAWAEGAQVQDPGEPARKAVKIVQSYGVRAVVVRDAAIKTRNPSALALTEGGVVYLTDALAEDDAETIAHHEAVHAVKQRGSAAYEALLAQEADRVDFSRGNAVMDLLLDSRFPGKDITSLDQAAMRTLFDELNALVWGCHMDDQDNARARFEHVFHDYAGFIGEMSQIMEQAKTEGENRYDGGEPVGDQSASGKALRERTQNAAKHARTGSAMGTETAGTGTREEKTGVTQRRFEYTGSVKQAVKQKWGEAGYGYIEKMMSDLQNGHKPTKAWSKAMSKLRSNYAGAVLTLNASVAMKQAASYPTAAAVLGWGPLAKAMKNFGKVDLDLIARYTPLQWYRSKGFSTQELGDMASRNKHLPKLLNWVQGVDLITTRKLWKASEYYVQAHNKALNRGTDAYYRAVADIYNQVIEETQPNYTTMQRPQLLRSDDNLIANLQMFKTQPFQNFNILYDAAGEFTAAMRRGDKAEIKQARAKVGRAVTSQLAQLAVFAGMGMVWAMFRGKKKKYEDEDGELTLQSAMSALGKDMAGGALSGIPFGSDAWELLSSKLFGDSYYGLDAVTVQALGDTIQSLDGMGELIANTVRAASAGEDIDWRSAGIKMDGYLDDISKAAGVPYENVVNLVHAIYRQVCVSSLGELQGEYAAMKLTVDPQKHAADYYGLLYKALEQGDLDSYFTIREELPELLGKDNSDIDGAMTSRYKAAVKKNPAYTLSERARDLLGIRAKLDGSEKEAAFGPDGLERAAYDAYTTQRAETYRETLDSVEDLSSYRDMDQATLDKLIDTAYTMAHQTALADNSDRKYTPSYKWVRDSVTAKNDYGISETEFLLWNAARSMTSSDRDENNKEIKGRKKGDKLRNWLNQEDLTPEQRAYLWGTEYKSAW